MPATVHVVEDDRPVRVVMSALLEEKGYAVVEASDGLEALDLRMPALDAAGGAADRVLSAGPGIPGATPTPR